MISINVLKHSLSNNSASVVNVVSKTVDNKVESLFKKDPVVEIKGTETIPVRTEAGDFKTVALEKLSSGTPIGNYIEGIPNDYGMPMVASLIIGTEISEDNLPGTLLSPEFIITPGIIAGAVNFSFTEGLRYQNGKLVLSTDLMGEGHSYNIATEGYVDSALKNLNLSNPTYDDSELRDAISEKVDADFVNEAIASAITLTINTAV